jgi:hypothetical protein
MTGIPSSEELMVVILLFMVLLVAGVFFIVRGLRLPGNFEANEKKRKELKQKVEAAEEKANQPEEKTDNA